MRQHKMSFYKFCWSQELNIPKESSFDLVRTWKTVVSHAVSESIKIQMLMSKRIEK